MSVAEAKKNLESVVAKAKLAVAFAAQEYVAALVRYSLGTAEAAEPNRRPGPRAATKRKAKGQPRKVTAKVSAPKTEKRKRTSAADIAKQKAVVLTACRTVGKGGASFKRPAVEAEIADKGVDVGRMLSLLTKDGKLSKRGDRRNTKYELGYWDKPNGAADHVARDAESISGEG